VSFNLLDLLAIGYTGYGAWRGARRGLSRELPRFIMILLFVLTGCTLSHWMRVIFGKINVVTGLAAGGVSFVALFAMAFLLARHARTRFAQRLRERFPDENFQLRGGAIVGSLRSLVIACTLIVFIGLMPLGFVSLPFAQGSFIGRNLIRLIVPVYEKIAGQPTSA